MSITISFRGAALRLALIALFLGGCGSQPQAAPIFEYRVEGDRQLSVRSSTANGWDTWIGSVKESSASIVVSVVTRRNSGGAGSFPAQVIWLPVKLDAPFDGRAVLDGASNTPVQEAPPGSGS